MPRTNLWVTLQPAKTNTIMPTSLRIRFETRYPTELDSRPAQLATLNSEIDRVKTELSSKLRQTDKGRVKKFSLKTINNSTTSLRLFPTTASTEERMSRWLVAAQVSVSKLKEEGKVPPWLNVEAIRASNLQEQDRRYGCIPTFTQGGQGFQYSEVRSTATEDPIIENFRRLQMSRGHGWDADMASGDSAPEDPSIAQWNSLLRAQSGTEASAAPNRGEGSSNTAYHAIDPSWAHGDLEPMGTSPFASRTHVPQAPSSQYPAEQLVSPLDPDLDQGWDGGGTWTSMRSDDTYVNTYDPNDPQFQGLPVPPDVSGSRR